MAMRGGCFSPEDLLAELPAMLHNLGYSAGAQGSEGPQGPAGPEGPEGPAGADGEDGAQGEQGVQGPQGDPGSQGIQGIPGAPGNDGAQGPQGDPGAPGEVPSARTITTTAPLTGGGDLSANRTLAVSAATTTAAGVVELATSGENAANVVVQGNDARLSDARTPTAHATSHENAGGDELSVAGLSGLLADGQTPLAHNILTAHNGFPGGTTNFLRADGAFAAPVGGGGLGYTLHVQALTSSPADGATVYFGQLPKAPIATAGVSRVYIRKAGTIKMANILAYSGTAGTAEAWSLYIRLNNSTDTLIETVSAATNERTFDNSSLSIAVVAGDYIEIKSVQPTWVTNPLTTIYGGYLYIE